MGGSPYLLVVGVLGIIPNNMENKEDNKLI